MAYEELGPYKYLLRMSIDADVRDAQRDAIGRLAEYDRARSTSLLPTLEEFLRRRGNISATAEACTSTRTRCVSGSGGSWISRASTCAATIG